jgi:hypothetical protein
MELAEKSVEQRRALIRMAACTITLITFMHVVSVLVRLTYIGTLDTPLRILTFLASLGPLHWLAHGAPIDSHIFIPLLFLYWLTFPYFLWNAYSTSCNRVHAGFKIIAATLAFSFFYLNDKLFFGDLKEQLLHAVRVRLPRARRLVQEELVVISVFGFAGPLLAGFMFMHSMTYRLLPGVAECSFAIAAVICALNIFGELYPAESNALLASD